MIEECPICSKTNCFENIDYTILGVRYIGVKCKHCKSILNSCKYEMQYDIDYIKQRFEDIINSLN